MCWCARRIFPFIKTWAPKENDTPHVLTFATSERDFNIAVRQHVEQLDEQYQPVNERIQCHTAANKYFKVTMENDAKPKSTVPLTYPVAYGDAS